MSAHVLLNLLNEFGYSINVFYCINKKAIGLGHKSTNISYGPPPTNVYINVMQTHDSGEIMLFLRYNNMNIWSNSNITYRLISSRKSRTHWQVENAV